MVIYSYIDSPTLFAIIGFQVRIWNVGTLNILPGTEFVNNSARLDDTNSIGALMVIGSHVNATGVSMVGNSGNLGGAAWIYNSGLKASLTGCSFVGNTAVSSSGALYFQGLDRCGGGPVRVFQNYREETL